MLPPLKSLAVNWVDGMKINKDHFEQSDAFTRDIVRDGVALFLNDYNYGLCPSVDGQSAPLNIKIAIDPAKIIRVQLFSCRAITPSGARIELGAGLPMKANTEIDKLQAEYHFEDSKEKNFYVLLFVNPEIRIPAGQPPAEEIPPRFPFVNSEYRLQILPESQISFTSPVQDAIIIGNLTLQAGKMKVDENYIPSVTRVSNYPILLENYFKLGNLMGETGKNIGTILEKIHSKSQTTSLVKSCTTVCLQVTDFIADNMGTYRWILSNQPPIFMLDCFLRLAYKFSTTLSSMPVKDKEELINYICEWVDETPSSIQEKTTGMIKSEYDHTRIADTLNKADEFMQMIHNIFMKLAQLDFIGKKKGERAFVQEKTVVVEPPVEDQSKKGWSFLAE